MIDAVYHFEPQRFIFDDGAIQARREVMLLFIITVLPHKRSYRLYHRSLNLYVLQKHLTKLKKIPRFSYLKEIGSQAVQDITQRIDRAYKLFFRNLKRKIRTAPPSFKKVRKYKKTFISNLQAQFVENMRLCALRT